MDGESSKKLKKDVEAGAKTIAGPQSYENPKPDGPEEKVNVFANIFVSILFLLFHSKLISLNRFCDNIFSGLSNQNLIFILF